jgi:hypothetical protein
MHKCIMSMISFIVLLPIMLWLVSLGPAFAQAGTSVTCADGKTVHVTTGTSTGSCRTNELGSKFCQEKNGTNSTSGGCVNGKAVCGDTSGSGDCTIATKQPTSKPHLPKGRAGLNTPTIAGAKSVSPGHKPPKGKGGVKPVTTVGTTTRHHKPPKGKTGVTPVSINSNKSTAQHPVATEQHHSKHN